MERKRFWKAICLAMMGAVLWAIVEPAPGAEDGWPPRETYQEQFPQATKGYREGMRLENAVGSFERNGDRIWFVLSDGQRLASLENLNLERIADKLDTDTGPLSWTVSGLVTEYRGRCYLLVSRAQAKRLAGHQARRQPKPAGG
jgi:hypothetical protein